jgi:hypothetical protein
MAQTRNYFMQCTFVCLLITLISFPSRSACRKQDNAFFYRYNLLETAALTGISASTGHRVLVPFRMIAFPLGYKVEHIFARRKEQKHIDL